MPNDLGFWYKRWKCPRKTIQMQMWMPFWSLTKGDENDPMVCKMMIRVRLLDLEVMLEVDVCKGWCAKIDNDVWVIQNEDEW